MKHNAKRDINFTFAPGWINLLLKVRESRNLECSPLINTLQSD